MRKIKLMALLLAALMIVAAFAGCAQVKQEEVDNLDERVTKLEGLLENLIDTVDKNNTANQKTLNEIKDAQDKINDAIENLGDRVEKVEEEPGKTDTPVVDTAALIAAKSAALAKLKSAQSAFAVEMASDAPEYSKATYETILAAIAKAEAAVNAATTVKAVEDAMAAYDAEVEGFKTQRVVVYEYYLALLGHMGDEGIEAVVAEAKAAIEAAEKELKELDNDGLIAYFRKEVENAASSGRTSYIDVYNAVKNLVKFYEDKSVAADLVVVDFVDANGKKDTIRTYTLAGLKERANSINAGLKGLFMTNNATKTLNYGSYQTYVEELDRAEPQIEGFLKVADVLGGETFTALILDLASYKSYLAVEAKVDSWIKAKDAFSNLGGGVRHGLAFYNDLLAYGTTPADVSKNYTFVDKNNSDIVFTNDYYINNSEKFEDWIAEYKLSYLEVAQIVEEVVNGEAYATKTGTVYVLDTDRPSNANNTTGDWYYQNYLLARHTVKLYADAAAKVGNVIKPNVDKLNKLVSLEKITADDVAVYNKIIDDFKGVFTVQTALTTKKTFADRVKNDTITADAATIREFIKGSGILVISRYNNDRKTPYIASLAGMNETALNTADENRLEELAGTSNANFASHAVFKEVIADLFTFESDIIFVETAANGLTGGYIADRKSAPIYNFFNVTYKEAAVEADKINGVITTLDGVKNTETTNEKFVLLEGKYMSLANVALKDTNIVFNGGKAYSATGDTSEQYIRVADYFENYKTYEAVLTGAGVQLTDVRVNVNDKKATTLADTLPLTIDYFNYEYRLFTSLIQKAKFDAAKTTAETRIKNLITTYTKADTGVAALVQAVASKTNNSHEWAVSLKDEEAVMKAFTAVKNWQQDGGTVTLGLLDDTKTGAIVKVDFLKDYKIGAVSVGTLAAEEKANRFYNIINTLKAKAQAIKDLADLINKVNTYNAISIANLNATGDDSFAIISKTTGSSAATTGVDVDLATLTFKTTITVSDIATKFELAQFFVALVNDFKACNIEWKWESGSWQNKGYDPYAPVDEIITAYTNAYDLVVAKAKIVAYINDKALDTTGSADQMNRYTAVKNALLNNVTYGTAADLNAGIKADNEWAKHNSCVADCQMTVANVDLAGYTLATYNFAEHTCPSCP